MPRMQPDKLSHDLRPLRIAEIEIVGNRQRFRTDGRQIAPAFRHRLLAAFERIRLAIARRHVGCERKPFWPVFDAHHRRVAARPLHGIAENDVVVLLPHPALRTKIRATLKAFECFDEAERRLNCLGVDFFRLGGADEGPLVLRRLVAELLDGQIGHHVAAMAHDEAFGRCGLADHCKIEAPLAEDRFLPLVLFLRLE